MSCISFNNPTRTGAYTAEMCAAPLPRSLPRVTRSKIARQVAMARSSNLRLVEAAAGSPWTPVATLATLARHPESSVRGWVARNPRLPEWILEWLTRDSDPAIAAFARHLKSQD